MEENDVFQRYSFEFFLLLFFFCRSTVFFALENCFFRLVVGRLTFFFLADDFDWFCSSSLCLASIFRISSSSFWRWYSTCFFFSAKWSWTTVASRRGFVFAFVIMTPPPAEGAFLVVVVVVVVDGTAADFFVTDLVSASPPRLICSSSLLSFSFWATEEVWVVAAGEVAAAAARFWLEVDWESAVCDDEKRRSDLDETTDDYSTCEIKNKNNINCDYRAVYRQILIIFFFFFCCFLRNVKVKI